MGSVTLTSSDDNNHDADLLTRGVGDHGEDGVHGEGEVHVAGAVVGVGGRLGRS